MYYNGIYFLFPVDLFTPALKASMFRISVWVRNRCATWLCTLHCFSVYVHRKDLITLFETL